MTLLIIHEIEILISERVLPMNLRHPNVVGLLDVVLADQKYDNEDSKEWKDAICLVFEFVAVAHARFLRCHPVE